MTMPQDDDVERIMAVMIAAFPPRFGEAWNRRQLGDALLLGNCRYGLIAAPSEQPDPATAGFFLARRVLDEEELLLFAVHPAYRRAGLGGALLRRMIAEARTAGVRRIFLEMRRGNPAAALYAAHGFHVIGERPGYYRTADGHTIDAISQELVLS